MTVYWSYLFRNCLTTAERRWYALKRATALNMFPRTHTDWSDPRFSKWKLPEKFNAEQQDAFLECNESEVGRSMRLDQSEKQPKCSRQMLRVSLRQIAAKPLTDDEVMSAFQQFNCRVDMRAGNICYKAEQKWPRTIFRKREFSELNKDDRNKLYEMLAQEGAAIYNDCVDVVRVKRRCKKARDEVLAPFFEERVLKLRYHAVMKPPPNESNASTLPSFWSSLPSFWSDQTAIGTATLDFNASSRDNPSPYVYGSCSVYVWVCIFAGTKQAS